MPTALLRHVSTPDRPNTREDEPLLYDIVICGVLRYRFGPASLVERLKAELNSRPHWQYVFACDKCKAICTEAAPCYCCAPRGKNSRPIRSKTGEEFPHHFVCETEVLRAHLDDPKNFIPLPLSEPDEKESEA